MDKALASLLSQVNRIEKKNAELITATGGRFNIFRILGVDRYENTHSTILTEFLNPKGSHGLKHKFLEAFIERNITDENIRKLDVDNAIVTPEFSMENGRMDILIHDSTRAIIIENKIDASDQNMQLVRYNKYAFKRFGKGNYAICYLTLLGDEASKQSGEGVNYLTLSYKNDVINWLEACVEISSRFPLVRETIIQYINQIKIILNQDMDTKNSEEIVDFLIKKDNYEAVLGIISNSAEFYKGIIRVYLVPTLQKIATDNQLVYKEDPDFIDGSKDASFEFYREEWGKLCIRFTFDKYNYNAFYWSLRCIDEMPEFGKEKWKDIGIFRFSQATGLKPYGDNWHKYRDWNIDTWKDIVNGRFSEEIRHNVEIVLAKIKSDPDIDM